MLPKPFLTLFTVYKREYLLKAKTGDYPVLFERFFFVSNALCLKTTTGKDCWCCSGGSNVHALYRKLNAMRSWASLLEKGPWTNRMVWGRFEAFCAFICSFPFQVSIFSATATTKKNLLCPNVDFCPGKTLLDFCLPPQPRPTPAGGGLMENPAGDKCAHDQHPPAECFCQYAMPLRSMLCFGGCAS